MIEAPFDQCNTILPGWSLRTRRDLGIPSDPIPQVVSGLQLSLDLIFLAARNVLGVCLSPRVKPSRFCLKLQCFEVKTRNIYFILPLCPDEVPHLMAIVKILSGYEFL